MFSKYYDSPIIKAMELNEEQRSKLNVLLFQLGDLLKEPPTILDVHDWKNNIDYVMQEIREISSEAYEKLDDLVTQVWRLGEQHVYEIDSDEPPNVVAHSAEKYFEQVSYVTSEINSLKAF